MPVATRSQRNVEDTPDATAPPDMLVVRPPTLEPTLHHGVCHTAALQPFTESADVPVALHTAVTNENHPKGKLVKSVPQKLKKGKKNGKNTSKTLEIELAQVKTTAMHDLRSNVTPIPVKSKAKVVGSHRNIPSLDVQDQNREGLTHSHLESTQVKDGSTCHPTKIISHNDSDNDLADSDDDWNLLDDVVINNASSMEGNGYHDLNQPDIIEGMSPIFTCCFKNLILFTRN